MSDLQNEISELKAMLTELHADQLGDKAAQGWQDKVSLAIVVIALVMAFNSYMFDKYTSITSDAQYEAASSQTLASNEWAYFQAKSIKQNLYDVSSSLIKALAPPANAAPKELSANYASKLAQYDNDKKEIKARAEALEAKRDRALALAASATNKSENLGLINTALQVAIALCSVGLVANSKKLAAMGGTIALGSVGGIIYCLLA